ncbi:PHP domain-containing protein [Aestuariimicrobium ganziense]|uniref:PHP domain-containing protein n=1 Tax=Aestuariimicrobium ganziense TaxID=2773677 RepID=UPI001F24AB35|nr:PHP domain-containing protein [Aestuariimicrobium ganziense]
MRVDLHTHSSVSDGTDTPTQLVHKAQASGLDVIGLTDHDTFDGIDEATEAGKRIGLTVVPGVEISCERNGASVHLLGFWCDRWHRGLGDELRKSRAGRTGRIEAMAERLTELGMPLTSDDIRRAAKASPSVGRPHVADAMVAKGYVANRNEAFDLWLADDKPGYVHRYAIPLELAIDLVHAAHGVAVLAHPWGRGRAHVLPADYIGDLVTDHGLDGIEVDHEDHDDDTRELLFRLGARLGLVRTGSSDYHGLGKEGHELGCNLTRASAFRELQRVARGRGARV